MYSINYMCLNPGDIVGGRYKIREELGRGGFGTTYEAYDNYQTADLPSVVAIKQIESSYDSNNRAEREFHYIERLEREANALRDLEHPCIPRFFESFTENNYYYIVMEYIDGDNLEQEIRPGEPIEEAAAVGILSEMLDILQFVHQNNIIHRDIKPSNIIRRLSDYKLVLIDFGAVKEVATEHTDAAGKISTRIYRTPGYTPQEQLAGMPRFSSDINALGITLMQGITGFSIEAIEHSEKIPRRNGQCNFIWEEYAPQIAPKYKEIISRMIEFYSENRYQNVEEVIHDLDRAINTLEDSEPDHSPIEPEPVPIPGEEEHNNSDDRPEPSVSFVEDILLTLRQFYARHRGKIIFITISIVAWLSVLLFGGVFSNSNVCALELEDNVSCGEEILNPSPHGSQKAGAAKYYRQQKYLEAFEEYQDSWQEERKAPDTLIYLNNALLNASNIETYKIAVAVPYTSEESNEIKSSPLAESFLRGVAQAQTEVNLSLSNSSSAIEAGLSEYEFLTPRKITSTNKNKGLEVVIIDDGNDEEQAQKVATEIAKKRDLLGVIGHYASKMTLSTVDTYEQQNIPLVSYGTTTKELSEKKQALPRDNFFRVVYTNEEEANVLFEYIVDLKNLPKKRIAIFGNRDSDYSNGFEIKLREKIRNLNDPNISIVKPFDIADEENFDTKTALKKLDDLDVDICILLPDGFSNSLANAIDVLKQDNGKCLMLGGNPLVNPIVEQLETSQPLNLVAATFWHHTTAESTFNQQAKKLWEDNNANYNANWGTAMAYDATLALIEAINRQTSPTRKGTIKELSAEDFSVPVEAETATGKISFNTPKNGDRKGFEPTLVRLVACEDGNRFINNDRVETLDLACQN